MDLRSQDLNLLVIFEALLETRSVSKASERLKLSQSSMSHALAKMRKDFDDPMFIRVKNEMLPTPRALAIAAAVKEVLAVAREQIFQFQAFAPERATQSFTLCMSDVGEMAFLPLIVNEVRRLAPNVKLATISPIAEKLEDGLESGRVDLGIGYFPDLRNPGMFQQRLLRSSGYVCIANSRHPNIGADGLNLKVFSQLPHVAVRTEGRSHQLVERTMQELNVSRNVVVTVPHFLALLGLIPHTELIAIISVDLAQGIRGTTGIAVYPLPFSSPHVEIVQVWHQRYHQHAANQWLRALVKNVLAKV